MIIAACPDVPVRAEKLPKYFHIFDFAGEKKYLSFPKSKKRN